MYNHRSFCFHTLSSLPKTLQVGVDSIYTYVQWLNALLKNKGIYPRENTGNIQVKNTFCCNSKGYQAPAGPPSCQQLEMLWQLARDTKVLGRKSNRVNIKYSVQRSVVFVHNLPPTSFPADSGTRVHRSSHPHRLRNKISQASYMNSHSEKSFLQKYTGSVESFSLSYTV